MHLLAEVLFNMVIMCSDIRTKKGFFIVLLILIALGGLYYYTE